MGRQPHVDALHVVQVLAQGQQPHHLAGLHRAEAHGALRAFPAALLAAVPGGVGVRELRQLGKVHGAAAAGLRPRGRDRRPVAELVAEEEDDGEERGAREADAGVAEDRSASTRYPTSFDCFIFFFFHLCLFSHHCTPTQLHS